MSLDTTHWYQRACRRALSVSGASPAFCEREDRFASPEMKAAIRFAGLGVLPCEVSLLAYLVFSVSLCVLLTGVSVAVVLLGISAFPAGAILLMIALAVPVGLLGYFSNYPKGRANELRVKSLGQMPEAVNYLVMAMRVNPSLDRAVEFAAQNTDGQVAASLRKVLWDCHLRRFSNIEESFLDFAREWGGHSDDFRRALHAVRASEMEATENGLRNALDKASDIALAGARRDIEEFSSSLSGPTFVLFSLGILLPMMLGAMLPMASMGGMHMGAFEVVFLLDVAIPLTTLAYARHILARRPGTSPPPEIATGNDHRTGPLTALACAGAISLVLLSLPQLNLLAGPNIWPVATVWAVALPASAFLLLSTARAKKELDAVRKLENDFPDALFQLGSRIGEGMPVEAALEKTAAASKTSESSKLLRRISYALRLTRKVLGDVLFGPGGMLVEYPSRTIRVSLRMVVESVKKDAKAAGTTIMGISQYLKELRKLDRDISNKLGSVTDTMRTTAMFFGPLVMGITASLFCVLHDVTSSLRSGNDSFGFAAPVAAGIAPGPFTLAVGLYVLLTVASLMHFTSGIRYGDSPVDARYDTGRALLVAAGIFTGAVALGSMMI